MKTHNNYCSLLWAPLVLAPLLSATADDATINRVKLEEPKVRTDRFSVSYSAAWNISAKFSGIGYGVGGNGRLPTAPGADRTYDDGYVRRFHIANDQHETANWGYRGDAGQVQGDTLFMHKTSATPARTDEITDDPQHGFQLTWNHEFWRDKKDCWRWGIEGAFGWNDIRLDDNDPLAAGTTRITDSYALNGVIPNVAPYWNPATQTGHRGSFNSDSPLIINEIAQRSTRQNAAGAFIFGDRHFDADFFFFHLGPYVEFPITEKLHGVVSGGLAFGIMAGGFEYDETVVIPRTTVTRTRADDDDTDSMFGGYISATLLYSIDNNWGVFVGGQFQTMSDYAINVNGRKATIDLGAVPFLTAGVSYSF